MASPDYFNGALAKFRKEFDACRAHAESSVRLNRPRLIAEIEKLIDGSSWSDEARDELRARLGAEWTVELDDGVVHVAAGDPKAWLCTARVGQNFMLVKSRVGPFDLVLETL